ncbi:carboxymuconolactone decarboxylase family protein [Paraburkholderia sp. J63]|uniref:carboxymuconolactone decarboxylase family protein n=1 Tax=Paraburkholderia sp. J63 TaxID=2805434 RepID=UPI002ABE12CF|nr:carboxymuconolactone decarboxylase family protein [Paraburkholderia sp. J63]
MTFDTRPEASATPVCDAMHESGAWNPLWDPFAQLDAAWTEKFMALAVEPHKVLDAKTIEFISIAVNAACTHMYAPGVRRHIRRALDVGATPEEIVAVLQGVVTLGIHSMSLGAPILLEELERRGQPGA